MSTKIPVALAENLDGYVIYNYLNFHNQEQW